MLKKKTLMGTKYFVIKKWNIVKFVIKKWSTGKKYD